MKRGEKRNMLSIFADVSKTILATLIFFNLWKADGITNIPTKFEPIPLGFEDFMTIFISTSIFIKLSVCKFSGL